MTLAEMRNVDPSAPVYVVLDGAGESATISVYRKHWDDFQEDEDLGWPDDWPPWVSVKFVKECGLEVIVA